ncbi:MAG: uL15m family ribosomal protein, partial [Deltaproteobacteria bacterium]
IVTLNIRELSIFPQGTVVNEELLISSGIIKRSVDGVKLLGNGTIENALTVELSLVSKGAREKIIAAGGSVASEIVQN